MEKRGISAIVATVLIVLITVAGVAIVWVAIVPMINENVDFDNQLVDLNIVTQEGYTVWDSDTKLVTVQVKQGSGDIVLAGIDFLFSFNGSSITISMNEVPRPNQKLVYYFNSSEYGEPISVSIAPVFSDGSVGDVSSTHEFLDGTLVDRGEIWRPITDVSVGAVGCVYSDWSNFGCGLGDCLPGEYYLSRSVVSGTGCSDTELCVWVSSCDLTSGAVAWWKFDGDATDSAGDNDGTLVGSGVQIVDGKLVLDGTYSYVNITNDGSLDLDKITISVWANVTDGKSYPTIIHKHRAWWFGLRGSAENFRTDVWTVDKGSWVGETYSPTPLNVDEWYLLTMTYDGSDVTLYENAVEVESSTKAIGGLISNNFDAIYIGSATDNSAINFQGALDDVMIFGRVLSESEIMDIYNSQKDDFDSQLVELSSADYYDKAYGGWLGQIAGNFLGRESEGMYSGLNPSTPADPADRAYQLQFDTIYYRPYGSLIVGTCDPSDFAECEVNSQTDDDTSIEWVDLWMLETYGLDVTNEEIKQSWESYIYGGIYFANKWAYNLMTGGYVPSDESGNPSGNSCPAGGCVPPYSGMEGYNQYWDFIDAQIEIEVFGALTPGMKDVAESYADKFARVTNDGYAVDFSKFYAMMYSEAFFEDDVEVIIEDVKNRFPSDSRVYEIVDDVQGWHDSNPYPNWRDTRQEIYTNIYLAKPHWIHADANFASTIMSVLYSKDEDKGVQFDRGIQIAALAGWDNDCNSPTTAGMLGVIAGAGNIPDKWKSPIRDFYDNTNRGTLPDDMITNIAQRTVDLGEQIILANGGVKNGNILYVPRS